MLLYSILGLLPIAALHLHAVGAAEVDGRIAGIAEEGQTSTLPVKVTAAFPEAEIFGVKLVNGRPTKAVLSVTNNDAAPITLRVIGGSLWSTHPGVPSQIVRNLTSTLYDSKAGIPAGASESFTYHFTTDMHPQDVRLNLIAGIVDGKQIFHSISGFNETVGIVEAPSSILDPQNIFLYLCLAVFFGAISYAVYSYWIVTLFPQQKRRSGGKGGERAKASSRGAKRVDPAAAVPVAGEDGPAVAAAASGKGYDESWIPTQHLKRPESKRIKSGTPTGVRVKKT